MSKKDLAYKICLFGDFGVGKTTLTHKYLYGFYDSNIKYTLGAEILAKKVEIEDFSIMLQIWDFGGQQDFRFLLTSYSKGASGGIYMYDITKYSSLEKTDYWLNLLREGLKENELSIPMLLVGGKLDLKEKRTFKFDEVRDFGEKYGFFDCIECSAKTGENVELIFETIVRKIMKEKGYF